MSELSETSVQFLKGVGPSRKKILENLGVESLEDLLYLFPRRYEDRRQMTKLAQIKIGEKLNIEQAKIFFSGKIFEFDGGEKWYIPDFIEFQYGELNESNRAHSSVLRILKQYNLLDIKPLTSPLQGAKDMDKDKEMDKDKDKDKDKEADFDFPKSDLDIAFDNWVAMRKKMKGGITDHAIELGKKELQELSNGNANLAIAIINRSILNSWKGFFPLSNKSQANGNSKEAERAHLREEAIAILTGGKNN